MHLRNDPRKGLYRKYEVSRTDGRDGPGQPHQNCTYFVLDIDHDQFAQAALRAYADACESTNPDLAADIRQHMLTSLGEKDE